MTRLGSAGPGAACAPNYPHGAGMNEHAIPHAGGDRAASPRPTRTHHLITRTRHRLPETQRHQRPEPHRATHHTPALRADQPGWGARHPKLDPAPRRQRRPESALVGPAGVGATPKDLAHVGARRRGHGPSVPGV